MNIDEKQLASKKKLIGKWGRTQVFHMITKGGYNFVVATKGADYETLGVGPHIAVARHIANRRAPDIQWTQLSKADHVPFEVIEHLIPKYEAMTDRFRERHGDE
jgi:hypothetical protein